MGIRGGAVCHARATAAGVRPKACLTRSLRVRSRFKVSAARARAGAMVRRIRPQRVRGWRRTRVPGRVRTTYFALLQLLPSSPPLQVLHCHTRNKRFLPLLGAVRIPVRNREPNRCNLEPFKPETAKITPYLVLAQGRLTLQVVCLGLAHSRLPVWPPKAPSRLTGENPSRPCGGGLGGGSCPRRPGGAGLSTLPVGYAGVTLPAACHRTVGANPSCRA